MSHWSLNDIPWETFDRSKVRPELVSLVKAACMVEHNSHDYARYLCEVFPDDADFQAVAKEWAEEEVQHGQALRRWAELADPTFNFDKSFAAFTTGYKLPVNVSGSVRGSRCGELIARCVVETGTSSYYTAIKEYSDEPVIQAVAARIAADEFRHYKLFYTHLNRYLDKEGIGFARRLRIALSRIAESEDDELAYAFFAAHHPDAPERYDHKEFKNLYLSLALKLYARRHIEKAVSMVFKVVDLKPHGWLNRLINSLLWNALRARSYTLKSYALPRAA